MFSKPSEMNATNDTPDDRFTSALAAIGALLAKELNELWTAGWPETLGTHFDIERASIDGKGTAFYRHIVPLRHALVTVLAGSYRRFFKLALANPRQTGRDPHGWAAGQLDPTVRAAIEWIFGWYVQACDGAKPLASVEVIPGQTISIPIPTTVGPTPRPEAWLAPVWLFEIGLAVTGIGTLKGEHVLQIRSEQKLSAAYTRLLLKGARRMFLWESRAAVENIKNEETAAAGTIPAQTMNGYGRRPNKRRGWEQRLKLYSVIQKILSDDGSLQGIEFCAELDKRHAPPLSDWKEGGDWREGLTWKEAWGDTALRRKIRRVRQEAMKCR